jgi:hypothetical protein
MLSLFLVAGTRKSFGDGDCLLEVTGVRECPCNATICVKV